MSICPLRLQLVNYEVVLRHDGFVDLHDPLAPVTDRILSCLQGVTAVEEHVAAGVRDQEERNRYLVLLPHSHVHLYVLCIGLEGSAAKEVYPQVVRHLLPPSTSSP